MKGFVYFIRPIGLDGPAKIGCSRVPKSRLAVLMSWSPVELEIAATVPGDHQLERRIHGLFQTDHMRHEWFRGSPRLSGLIRDLAAGRPIEEAIDLTAPVPKFLAGRHSGRVPTPERMKYRSFKMRLTNSIRGTGALSFEVTDQVRDIMEAWDTATAPVSLLPYRKGKAKMPSPAELTLIERAITEPEKFVDRRPLS